MVNIKPLISGCRKLSAKSVTRATQRRLRHEDFLETLNTGNVFRSENTRITLNHHILQTVSSNKICLSAFDNKRFIKADGIHTLPFGHYEALDCGIDDIDWDNANIEWDHNSFDSNLCLSSDQEWDNDFVVSQTSSTAAQSSAPSSWQPPDPGFAAALAVTESDIESDDLIDFDASSDESSSASNPFINFEAEEASSSDFEEPPQKILKRR